MSELLIGCGSNRIKKMHEQGRAEWSALVTLDNNADHAPDFVYDMAELPLPFPDNAFDEIHAYECLEHVGAQGDYRFFFAQWDDFWRLLVPGGMFFGTVPLPQSPWAWGDPSHTRVLPKEVFTFLCRPQYEQVGVTAMSDFRGIYRGDFDIEYMHEAGDVLAFALRAVKPAR